MNLTKAIDKINSYQEFIDLLEEERTELNRLIDKKEGTVLQRIELKKRLWNVKSEILAKRQYVEMYRQRAHGK